MKILILLSTLFCFTATADVYELRTYFPAEGKLEALEARFRDHTVKLFEKHGMKNVGYWLSEKKEGEVRTLIYIVAHKDRAAAKASWSAFGKDPDWKAARDATRARASATCGGTSWFAVSSVVFLLFLLFFCSPPSVCAPPNSATAPTSTASPRAAAIK